MQKKQHSQKAYHGCRFIFLAWSLWEIQCGGGSLSSWFWHVLTQKVWEIVRVVIASHFTLWKLILAGLAPEMHQCKVQQFWRCPCWNAQHMPGRALLEPQTRVTLPTKNQLSQALHNICPNWGWWCMVRSQVWILSNRWHCLDIGECRTWIYNQDWGPIYPNTSTGKFGGKCLECHSGTRTGKHPRHLEIPGWVFRLPAVWNHEPYNDQCAVASLQWENLSNWVNV